MVIRVFIGPQPGGKGDVLVYVRKFDFWIGSWTYNYVGNYYYGSAMAEHS